MKKKIIGSNFFNINHKKECFRHCIWFRIYEKIEKNYPSLRSLNCADEIRKIKVA